jgi:UV DNA damage endonuclease
MRTSASLKTVPTPFAGIRFGLCCTFADEPSVRYRTSTAYLNRLSLPEAQRKLKSLIEWNAEALRNAIQACKRLSIRAYRIPSRLLPLGTHPDWSYGLEDLPVFTFNLFDEAKSLAQNSGIRLSFHPDQFVVLGSRRAAVTKATLQDLQLQGQLAELIGANSINLHAGGAYGDKPEALERVARTLDKLPASARERITLENDDRVFSVGDLLPFCRREGVPLTYDVHHHRCLPDDLTVAEATRLATTTWDREPIFHLSSPKGGWSAINPRQHADLIDRKIFRKNGKACGSPWMWKRNQRNKPC